MLRRQESVLFGLATLCTDEFLFRHEFSNATKVNQDQSNEIGAALSSDS